MLLTVAHASREGFMSTFHRSNASRSRKLNQAKTEKLARSRRKGLAFDVLEDRLMLTHDPFYSAAASADAVDLTLRVEDVDGAESLSLWDSILGRVASEPLADITSLVRIIGSDHADTIRTELDETFIQS